MGLINYNKNTQFLSLVGEKIEFKITQQEDKIDLLKLLLLNQAQAKENTKSVTSNVIKGALKPHIWTRFTKAYILNLASAKVHRLR